MNGKLYIKKFIRDDGETLSFDAEEIYLSENNTLLVRSDPATTAVEFTEEDGGEMIRQRGATYSQPVSGLIVPKSTEYWALCVRLSRFFILNHTYKIVYIKRDGSMFSMNRAWINAGLQIVPVPYENYSTWTIEFRIGDNFWTEYAEDGQGKEIYSNSVELPLLTAGTGGEVWSDAIQQTLSGLGNYFAIDGTSISASINKLELKGDTFQQTYTGKNLSPYPYSDGGSKVIRGITFTAASDGSVTLNGTNDGNANSAYYIYYSDSSSLQFEAGTYYFVPPSNTAVGYVMYDGTSYYDFSNANNYSQTFSSAKSIRYIYIQVRKQNTTTFNNLKIYPMLTTLPNPTESDYEPYVGGIPAPNPDYPQDVHVVTGEQTVEVTGKNLCNGVSQGYWLTSTAQNAGVSANDSGLIVAIQPNTNYTVSTTASQARYRVAFSDEIYSGTTLVCYNGSNRDGTSATITSNSGSHKYLIVNATDLTKVQIEEGSSATTYEPFQSQAYEINLGKNLLPITMTNQTLNDVSFTVNEDKSIKMSGTATARIEPRIYQSGSGVPRVTLKSGVTYHNCMQEVLYFYSGSYRAVQPNGDYTPSTDETISYAYIRVENGATVDKTIYPMIIEGSTATSYAPYFTPIELCKIGDYQDYIYKSGDDWYIHKETNSKTLNGSEFGWGKSGTSSNNAYYLSTAIFSDINRDGMGVGVSDTHVTPSFSYYFAPQSPNNIFASNVVGLGFNAQQSPATNIDLRIGTGLSSTLNTLQLFKDWLASNPVTVYYALATPTNIQIENPDLVAQLNALAGAQAYNGKTVYQTNSATMPAILSVELLQSVGGGEVWDNVGAVWEEGVGGVQTINVETTQTTYPVWTVTGPCSNPTLQNDTTDTLASFDGMIASGQTLTVNFADNTAYLDSAPVAKYVSGYVSLAPGENVIGFNSDGGSTQTSTISWDNIIN